mmetsp:Transcript_4045/g.7358  ORF Transcript_4045/g.7358 Transcript_4045/m.7358 type:complete len:201 (-) Transcript_4045:76-678(-)
MVLAGLVLAAHLTIWPVGGLRDVTAELDQELDKKHGEHYGRRQTVAIDVAHTADDGRTSPEPDRTAGVQPVAVNKVGSSSNDSSACFVDRYGYSGGCKVGGCMCPVLQHCYPKFAREEGGHRPHDVGVCGPDMWFMAFMSAFLFGAFVFALMVFRSCLQYDDKTRELTHETAAMRSLARARRNGLPSPASRGNAQSPPDG